MTEHVELEIATATSRETHELRRSVLRRDTPSSDVELDGDDEETTRHLVARAQGRIVGVSTWLRRPCPHTPGATAVQLRAMAVDPAVRRRGIGAALLRAGLGAAREAGAEVVWARARDTALGFYQQFGFETVGDGYDDSATALPHHDIVMRLSAIRPS